MTGQFTEEKSGAYVLLKGLSREGIDKIFMVSGTDYAAFIEEKVRDQSLPDFIIVPHEITAASAALGYSLGGKLGVVAVHTVPGTANALGIIANAFTSRIPLLVIAGRSPYTEEGSTASRNLRIHWTQEARDQGGLVRQYVKWDFEIRRASQTEVALMRALQIARSEPRGPVYLVVPREVSIETSTSERVPMDPYEPGPSPKALERVQELLKTSERPAIVTWRVGRRESWYASLKGFAERIGAPVLNYVGEVVNYPSSGDMALDRMNLSEPDLILVVEAEVPWIPKRVKVNSKVVRIDVEPSYSYIPYYGFKCDVCVQSTPEALGMIRAIPKDTWGEEVKERVRKRREEKARELEKMMNAKKIHPRLLSHLVSKLGGVIFNEYPLNPRYAELSYGQYFGDLSEGHLGWSLGAAFGYRMATGKDVIATVGDGSFIFGVPEAFFHACASYGQPALVVIYDNGGWLASAEAVDEVFPEGLAKATSTYPGADFKRYDIGETVRAFGGHFRLVETVDEVSEALGEAWDKVRRGQLAVVQIIVERTR